MQPSFAGEYRLPATFPDLMSMLDLRMLPTDVFFYPVGRILVWPVRLMLDDFLLRRSCPKLGGSTPLLAGEAPRSWVTAREL